MTEFVAWPKTPRLFRNMIVTEKIDGTNAAVVIEDRGPYGTDGVGLSPAETAVVAHEGRDFVISVQSRKRLITPESDNFGFARWVAENAQTLIRDLGTGRHFGEWWGKGIQRGYGLDHKRFSLFNTTKWSDKRFSFDTPELDVVPVIWEGTFSTQMIEAVLDDMRMVGSHAVLGFGNPEGVCVFHEASNQVYKVLLENDDVPKSLAAA